MTLIGSQVAAMGCRMCRCCTCTPCCRRVTRQQIWNELESLLPIAECAGAGVAPGAAGASAAAPAAGVAAGDLLVVMTLTAGGE